MVDDGGRIRAIEGGGQPSLRDGHSEPVPETLAERTGGDFNTRRRSSLRMTRCSAVPLPKLLQVVHREVEPGEK